MTPAKYTAMPMRKKPAKTKPPLQKDLQRLTCRPQNLRGAEGRQSQLLAETQRPLPVTEDRIQRARKHKLK